MEKRQANCMNKDCAVRIVGTCLDGISCPVCNGPVRHVPFDGLPGAISYRMFKKNNKPIHNMERKYRIAYVCLDCERECRIPMSRGEYNEICSEPCLACNGTLVDKWMIGKYEHSKKDNNEKVPLLQIELQDINSVPKVMYNGDEIALKMNVSFEWETADEHESPRTYINIKHHDEEAGRMNTKTIQHNKPIRTECVELYDGNGVLIERI
ncbi:hypothetical protein [Cytobacillus horneckiae]|uniref:hypothetical protein n=1 Tax=Cytobacillus horneckiae TaxID=549687 RepID=UPI00203AD2B4|nr:hypothetical protein [Cytobacillus horneckiae]MCM3180231.1 hypothetical protein [Cytobacillus horneckiae]